MEQHDHRDGTYKKEAWVTVAFWDEGLSLIGFVTVFVRTVRVIFPSHRQSGTGSVVFTATFATSALSQITSKTKTDRAKAREPRWFVHRRCALKPQETKL